MAARRLRIAFARVSQETNALSPVLTTLADFERTHLVSGEALLAACSAGGVEAPGFLRSAELTGFVRASRAARGVEVECVPILSAWAIPGGPLSREAFDALAGRLAEGLRAAGPLDGVLLCLHGAMGVVGLRDPDSALVRVVRERVGPGVPVAVTHDLHANLTRARVELADILVAYDTNPPRGGARGSCSSARRWARCARRRPGGACRCSSPAAPRSTSCRRCWASSPAPA
jgi:microcystin degradation protein MlrC